MARPRKKVPTPGEMEVNEELLALVQHLDETADYLIAYLNKRLGRKPDDIQGSN